MGAGLPQIGIVQESAAACAACPFRRPAGRHQHNHGACLRPDGASAGRRVLWRTEFRSRPVDIAQQCVSSRRAALRGRRKTAVKMCVYSVCVYK